MLCWWTLFVVYEILTSFGMLNLLIVFCLPSYLLESQQRMSWILKFWKPWFISSVFGQLWFQYFHIILWVYWLENWLVDYKLLYHKWKWDCIFFISLSMFVVFPTCVWIETGHWCKFGKRNIMVENILPMK